MKKTALTYFFRFIFLLITNIILGQVGIGTTTPNGALEISSTNQGLIIPRVSLIASNVSQPVINPNGSQLLSGTMVYNTATAGTSPNNVIPGFYFWDGSKWLRVTSQATTSNTDWSLTGNTGTTAGTNFIGTLDATDLVTKTDNAERMRITATGNVGIGTNSPITELQVNGGATNKNGISVRGNADWDALTLAHDGSVAYINASGVENGIAIRTNDFASGNAISNSYTEQVRILNNGNVGIGTNAPTTTLHIRNTTSPALRIVDGTQGNGKILTSDASGNATWQDNNLPMISAFQGMIIPICANVSTNSTGSFVIPINGVNTTVSWTVLSKQTSNASFPIKAERLQVR